MKYKIAFLVIMVSNLTLFAQSDTNKKDDVITIDNVTFDITGVDKKIFRSGKQINLEVKNVRGDTKDSLTISFTSKNYNQSGLQTKFTSLIGVDTKSAIVGSNETFITQTVTPSKTSQTVTIEFDKKKKYSLERVGKKLRTFKVLDERSEHIMDDIHLWAQPRSIHYLPIQVQDADLSILEINRYDKVTKQLKETREYKFHNSNGVKIDFSAGIFGTTLNHEVYKFKDLTLQDTVYFSENFIKTDSIIDINDVGKKQIFKEGNQNGLRVGIGILAHLHSRWGDWFNIGISTGFEIDSDAKVGYLLGGSLFFGNRQRFILTGGLAFAQLKVRSSLYEVGDIVNPGLAIENVTTDAWKRKWFVGLTYNL